MVLSVGMLLSDPRRGLAGIVSRRAGGCTCAPSSPVQPACDSNAGIYQTTAGPQRDRFSCRYYGAGCVHECSDPGGTFLLVAAALNTAEERRENAGDRAPPRRKAAATGRFAATVAHEMNNPLAAVVNLIYLAQSLPEAGTHVRGLLEAAQQELKRVAHISRQTLAFYKDNATAENFESGELLQDIVFMMQAKIQNKNLVLETRCAGCWINAVKGEVRQVVSNLVSNAIDASSNGGSFCCAVVRLARTPSASKLQIMVKASCPVTSGNSISRFSPPRRTWATVGAVGEQEPGGEKFRHHYRYHQHRSREQRHHLRGHVPRKHTSHAPGRASHSLIHLRCPFGARI